jgi:DNA-binding MarR family transcriptional regulator
MDRVTAGDRVGSDVDRSSAEASTPDEGSESSSGQQVSPYLFGDLLALARARWIREMAEAVAQRGYLDYRATDAHLVRLLRRRSSVAISGIGSRLGVTRQAARKLVNGLERRGYAAEVGDEHDTRVVKVELTREGEAYADTVIEVIHTLNRQLAERVGTADLAVADAVLREILSGEDPQSAATRPEPPP